MAEPRESGKGDDYGLRNQLTLSKLNPFVIISNQIKRLSFRSHVCLVLAQCPGTWQNSPYIYLLGVVKPSVSQNFEPRNGPVKEWISNGQPWLEHSTPH